MKELRIFLSILCLLSLTTLCSSVSAGDDERSENRVASSTHRVHTEIENEVEHTKLTKKKITKKATPKSKTTPKTQKPLTPAPKTPSVPTPAKPTPSSPAPTASVTKSATVSYRTPGGTDPVTFSVTAQWWVITAASAITKANNETSIWYQDSFGKALSQSVVGKKVSGLSLSAVGWASLTTWAFLQFVSSSF